MRTWLITKQYSTVPGQLYSNKAAHANRWTSVQLMEYLACIRIQVHLCGVCPIDIDLWSWWRPDFKAMNGPQIATPAIYIFQHCIQLKAVVIKSIVKLIHAGTCMVTLRSQIFIWSLGIIIVSKYISMPYCYHKETEHVTIHNLECHLCSAYHWTKLLD